MQLSGGGGDGGGGGFGGWENASRIMKNVLQKIERAKFFGQKGDRRQPQRKWRAARKCEKQKD